MITVSPWHARADRARALTRFFEADALKSAGMTALAYLMRTDERQRDPAVLATHGEALRVELARWEAYLGVAGYVCGDQLTLALGLRQVPRAREIGLAVARRAGRLVGAPSPSPSSSGGSSDSAATGTRHTDQIPRLWMAAFGSAVKCLLVCCLLITCSF